INLVGEVDPLTGAPVGVPFPSSGPVGGMAFSPTGSLYVGDILEYDALSGAWTGLSFPSPYTVSPAVGGLASVPEPTTALLLATGLARSAMRRRRLR
ncbi:MAG: PEP-CTERM sorting domain-containing protein, partial [Deltaproteobacteria bacterium]|nr:PEP-CTERM sorting domain-containing protein [Deltaproteobacteria bacterium]